MGVVFSSGEEIMFIYRAAASHASRKRWPHSDNAVFIASTLRLGRRLRSQMLGWGLQEKWCRKV